MRDRSDFKEKPELWFTSAENSFFGIVFLAFRRGTWS